MAKAIKYLAAIFLAFGYSLEAMQDDILLRKRIITISNLENPHIAINANGNEILIYETTRPAKDIIHWSIKKKALKTYKNGELQLIEAAFSEENDQVILLHSGFSWCNKSHSALLYLSNPTEGTFLDFSGVLAVNKCFSKTVGIAIKGEEGSYFGSYDTEKLSSLINKSCQDLSDFDTSDDRLMVAAFSGSDNFLALRTESKLIILNASYEKVSEIKTKVRNYSDFPHSRMFGYIQKNNVLKFSSDDSIVMEIFSDGIVIYYLESETSREIILHNIIDAIFGEDDRSIIVSTNDNFLTFNLRHPINKFHKNSFKSKAELCKFSNKNKYLAIKTDKALYIHDLINKKRAAKINQDLHNKIQTFAFSGDDHYLFTMVNDRVYRFTLP